MATTQIILASNNHKKCAEIQASLSSLSITLLPQSEFQVSSVEECGQTFIENALIKARHTASYTKLPALADDSGLVVETLKGAPGIYSARYAGPQATDAENNQKLLAALQHCPENQRQAHFYCVLVYLCHAQDPEPLICEGRWPGMILPQPQGEQGFGYDPIFYVPTHQCSAAQLTLKQKNQISHRGQALQILKEKLKSIIVNK